MLVARSSGAAAAASVRDSAVVNLESLWPPDPLVRLANVLLVVGTAVGAASFAVGGRPLLAGAFAILAISIGVRDYAYRKFRPLPIAIVLVLAALLVFTD
jgi:hypothetical protein